MTLQQHIEDSLEKVTPEIIKILSYQASITAQGINYTGEKDWALNKIKDVIKQSLLEQADILRGNVEKLKCDESKTRVFGEWIAETYEDKMLVNAVIQDVLNLLKTNQE